MNACKDCPFRCGSPEGYCVDGFDALDAGKEPGCHQIVGRGLQFDDPMPSEKTACKGFRSFKSGRPGYATPAPIESLYKSEAQP